MITAALVYAIVSIPSAIQIGMEKAAPVLAREVEKNLMVNVQEAIKSPEVMDQISASIRGVSTDMANRLVEELPSAIRDAILQMLTASNPQAEQFAQNITREAIAALPNQQQIEAMADKALRDELSKKLSSLVLDQKTMIQISTQVIERRLLGAPATPAPSPTPSPSATPHPTYRP